MIPERPALERRILTALEATPSRIPVLVGACGSGRTQLLRRLALLAGEGASQSLDIERAASTPEGFYAGVIRQTPFTSTEGSPLARDVTDGRAAFDAWFAMLSDARGPGGQAALFLVDEFLELRMFESFPGLRGVVRELVERLVPSPNRFVLTTRFVSRAHPLLPPPA